MSSSDLCLCDFSSRVVGRSGGWAGGRGGGRLGVGGHSVGSICLDSFAGDDHQWGRIDFG